MDTFDSHLDKNCAKSFKVKPIEHVNYFFFEVAKKSKRNYMTNRDDDLNAKEDDRGPKLTNEYLIYYVDRAITKWQTTASSQNSLK